MKWIVFIELIVVLLAMYAVIKGLHTKDVIMLGEGTFILAGIGYIRGIFIESKLMNKIK